MKFLSAALLAVLLTLTFSSSSFAQSAPYATNEAKFINVDYTLPYPGSILPDNPLYLLKAIRDNLYNLFIFDPVAKANYDLLMANKRLQYADKLIDKKEYQLSLTTLGKSGNYFDEAIQLAANTKSQGKDVSDLLNNLYLASQKHQQVIYEMSLKTTGDIKYQLELAQVRAKSFQDTVSVVRSR